MKAVVCDKDMFKQIHARRKATGADRWDGVYMIMPLPNDVHQEGDRFRLRRDPEQAIGRHRLLRGDIRKSNGVERHNLVLVGNQSHGTGQRASIDVRLERGGNRWGMRWFLRGNSEGEGQKHCR